MEDYWGIIYAIMKSLGINELEKQVELINNQIKELKRK